MMMNTSKKNIYRNFKWKIYENLGSSKWKISELNPKLRTNKKKSEGASISIDPGNFQYPQTYDYPTPSIQSTSQKPAPSSEHLSHASQTNFSNQIIKLQATIPGIT